MCEARGNYDASRKMARMDDEGSIGVPVYVLPDSLVCQLRSKLSHIFFFFFVLLLLLLLLLLMMMMIE